MKGYNVPANSERSLSSSKLTAAFVATFAMLTAACGDPASSINAPTFSSQSIAASTPAAPNFVMVANAALTCTGGSIDGSVGTFEAPPTGSVTMSSCPLTGTIHVGDLAAKKAYQTFLNAYTSFAPSPTAPCTVLTGTLAGRTLFPGSYCFDAGATLTGVLTLRGSSQRKWIFRVGTSGTGALSGTNFTVLMKGGAQACNVAWWVAEGATMTTSDFQGNVVAGTYVRMTGGTFNGRAGAKADATITGTAVTNCKGSGASE